MTKALDRPARTDLAPEQVEAIRRTVAKDLSEPEFVLFAEVVSRYQLDPFAGQIYATKMPGKNGGRGRMAIIVGRDGFLTIASRDPAFDGLDGDVVREKDDFQMMADRSIHHAYKGGPEQRGKIVGAWAAAYRKDRPRPTFFFANFEEYVATKDVWKRFPSAMILKVAEVSALRRAFAITGLVGEEEVDSVLRQQGGGEPVSAAIEWGEDEVLAERLQGLYRELNKVKDNAYRPAKIKAELAGLDHEGRVQKALDLETVLVEAGGSWPPDEIEAEAEEVTDES